MFIKDFGYLYTSKLSKNIQFNFLEPPSDEYQNQSNINDIS